MYSIAEYEANTAPNGFFETYGGEGIDHEIIWDVREHEGDTEATVSIEDTEATVSIEKKKGRPFQKGQ